MENKEPINGIPEVGFEAVIDWVTPAESTPVGPDYTGEKQSPVWWRCEMRRRLNTVLEKYSPDGFMLLENELMDSSKFGRRYVLPFGGTSSNERIITAPFSVDGTASGTVCLKAVWRVKNDISKKTTN